MVRSKRIILLCHCILNANAKVEGLATYGSIIKNVLDILMQENIGIIQLPCPELTMLGIRRWGQTVEQYNTPYYRKHCRALFTPIMEQIMNYIENDYEIVGLIGIEGSPSCGIHKTCSAQWGGELCGHSDLQNIVNQVALIEESGIFIDEIKRMLEENKISIPLIVLDETDIEASCRMIEQRLKPDMN